MSMRIIQRVAMTRTMIVALLRVTVIILRWTIIMIRIVTSVLVMTKERIENESRRKDMLINV